MAKEDSFHNMYFKSTLSTLSVQVNILVLCILHKTHVMAFRMLLFSKPRGRCSKGEIEKTLCSKLEM